MLDWVCFRGASGYASGHVSGHVSGYVSAAGTRLFCEGMFRCMYRGMYRGIYGVCIGGRGGVKHASLYEFLTRHFLETTVYAANGL